ncbi:DNA photolyase [Candidatus Desulfarcum epimagneticum]|uniref:DNA photolyase n=1 Tax=uncultured Desulfobacteraceae bacterium TaxID=218296 RepID=A0A484HI72_9BACT|nr:DNA photolyase [uncultured Desulfobacteraceae bacterium]
MGVIKRARVEESAAVEPETASILSKIGAPHQTIGDAGRFFDELSRFPGDRVLEGKRRLLLSKNKGAFIKECPGTSHYTCCGYQILHIGSYCVMDCAYCILQAYFHPPALTYFVNHRDLFDELDRFFAQKKSRRLGTGEFTDSLIWDKWTNISARLSKAFSSQSHAVLELKTKTASVEGLKDVRHNQKTIMAWSLNAEPVIRSEERGTAPLDARLEAAAKCRSWGYPVAFHFDPMIIYDGWEKDYRDVVKKMFDRVPPDSVVWISVGAFRFMPSLKKIIQTRFPESKIVYGEFVTGMDGKMRYFKPLRMEMYRKMVGWIKERAPGVQVYFCMEDDEVWENALGFVPGERGGLSKMLDDSAVFHCGLD